MGAPTELVDLRDLKKELVNYAYYKLHSSDSKSRVTQSTTTFDGDGNTTNFDLGGNLRFIDPFNVTVDGVTQDYGTDWDFITDPDDADFGNIIFTTAPASGTDNISITYGTGSQGWIYPDFPRRDLAVSQYPRVAITTVESPQPGGLGGNDHVIRNEIRISILYLAENTRVIDNFAHTIKDGLVKDAKRMFNFHFITPDSGRPFSLSEDSTGMVSGYNQDFRIPNRYSITGYNT